jgi:hypothetical protein
VKILTCGDCPSVDNRRSPQFNRKHRTNDEEETMTAYKRFLLGGVSALLPILLTIGVADAKVIAGYLQGDLYAMFGYAIRTLALFTVGGLWAYSQRSEVQPFKVMQLGVTAPAMLALLLNASTVSEQRGGGPSSVMNFEIISSAHAQEQREEAPPTPNPLDSFIKGVLGK